jgi:hypothetical protein
MKEHIYCETVAKVVSVGVLSANHEKRLGSGIMESESSEAILLKILGCGIGVTEVQSGRAKTIIAQTYHKDNPVLSAAVTIFTAGCTLP